MGCHGGGVEGIWALSHDMTGAWWVFVAKLYWENQVVGQGGAPHRGNAQCCCWPRNPVAATITPSARRAGG